MKGKKDEKKEREEGRKQECRYLTRRDNGIFCKERNLRKDYAPVICLSQKKSVTSHRIIRLSIEWIIKQQHSN